MIDGTLLMTQTLSGVLIEVVKHIWWGHSHDIDKHIRHQLARYPVDDATRIYLAQTVRGYLNRLGSPTSTVHPALNSPRGTAGGVQRFTGGSIYTSEHGAFPVWGWIARCYERLGGTSSRLGFPTSPEFNAIPSPHGTHGQVQRFEGSPDDTCRVSIYASEYGAWAVWGAIACRYEADRGTASHLGFPIGAETRAKHVAGKQDGWVQYFEGGDLWV